jgi:uncharacterized protein YjbI with pentapeptide repeats
MGRLSRHSIAFAIFLLLMLIPGLAQACSCGGPDPAALVRGAHQIFEGYVETVEEADATGPYNGMKKATIHVLQVWKGDVPETITFSYGEADAACQYGAVGLHTTQRFFTYGDPSRGPVTASWCTRMAGHHGGAPLEQELMLYADRLQALRQDAARGTVPSKLALAVFLLEYSGAPEAVRILQLVLRDEPNAFEEWVVDGGGYDRVGKFEPRWSKQSKAVQPATRPEPRGQMARAIFAVTGRLDPSWKDWSGLMPLSQCDLDGITLEDITFADSALSGCSFRRAILSRVDFSGAQMSSVVFDDAQLNSVKLGDISTYQTSFKSAQLKHVAISGSLYADLSGAILEDVTITDVDYGVLDLASAKLKNVVISGGDIREARTTGASFENVQFKGSRLLFLKLQGTDLRGVDFIDMKDLSGYVDCSTRLPDSISADSPKLVPIERGCLLGRPDGNFRGAAWSHFDLSGLNFEGGDFTGASLSGVKLNGTNLANANLSGIDFNYTKFSGANLDGATLSGATNLKWFAESKRGVTGVIDAPPASLRGTIFNGATIPITGLVGIAGYAASIDLDAPNFDNVTIDCWERPLEHYLNRPLRNDAIAAAQDMREAQAIVKIRKKWPTAKLTDRCSALH